MLIPTDISQLKSLCERHDATGQRIPVSIKYACLDGAIIDIREPVMVCISADPHTHTRKFKSIASGDIRSVYDALILRVNNAQIVVK